MIYSNRIAARLAQFKMGNTLLDGTVIDPAAVLDPSFSNADYLYTVNWAVAPTPQRCLPEAPYRVELAKNVEIDNSNIDLFDFSQANAHTLYVNEFFKQPLLGWGAITVGFSVTVATDVEFYATDFLGEELHGSRRQAANGQDCVFFGPGIFAIRATGNATVNGGVALAVPGRDISYTLLAEVGPAFEPAVKPGTWPYDGQSYLSNIGLSPSKALTIRQTVDSLARQTTLAPASSRLNTEVHRRSPKVISDELNQQEVIRQAAEHFADIRSSPFWSYDVAPSITGGATNRLHVSVGPILQLLARFGPVEALTLGQAVTVPVSGDQFPLIADQSSAYSHIFKTGKLPFPLIRVSGQFYDNVANVVVEEFAFAGLELPIVERLFSSAKQTAPRRPQALDGPATADIKTTLAKNSSSLTYFISIGSDDKGLVLENNRPKAYLTETSEPSADNPGGDPTLKNGPVDLPFDAVRNQPLQLYPRDVFGRWPSPDNGACLITPWPVGAPGLQSLLVEYFGDDSVGIRIVVQWDRTVRRQADISLGVRLVAAKLTDTTALETPFSAKDGIMCPAFPSGGNLAIVFDVDGKPSIKAQSSPAGLAVQLVQSTSEPDQIGGTETSKLQRYELIVPLGSAAKLMTLLTDPDSRLFVQVVADASERVSGNRRTDPPLPRLTKQIDDPRSPVIMEEPWQIYWTGLPNATTGEARALLALPSIQGTPAAVGYYAWQAHETAVLEFILDWEFPDNEAAVTHLLTVIRREQDMPARLALFQYLIKKNLTDPDFRQRFTTLFRVNSTTRIPTEDEQVEIILSASQTGFEFVLFTAVSASGVESAKDPLMTLRILAVPSRRQIPPPSLRIITTDDTGLFESSNLCLAIVSHMEPFEAEAVRFFWGSGDIPDANALLTALPPVSHFTVDQAAAYIFEIADIISKSVSFPYVRLFLLTTRCTKDLHNFAVDIKPPNGTLAPDQIPSPRSQMQSHFLST